MITYLLLSYVFLFVLQNNILSFMDIRFAKITSVQRAVQLLKKFERLELPNLGIPEKYAKILAAYGREVDMVSKFYQKNKQDPPIGRDLPEMAGKVSVCIVLSRNVVRRNLICVITTTWAFSTSFLLVMSWGLWGYFGFLLIMKGCKHLCYVHYSEPLWTVTKFYQA